MDEIKFKFQIQVLPQVLQRLVQRFPINIQYSQPAQRDFSIEEFLYLSNRQLQGMLYTTDRRFVEMVCDRFPVLRGKHKLLEENPPDGTSWIKATGSSISVVLAGSVSLPFIFQELCMGCGEMYLTDHMQDLVPERDLPGWYCQHCAALVQRQRKLDLKFSQQGFEERVQEALAKFEEKMVCEL